MPRLCLCLALLVGASTAHAQVVISLLPDARAGDGVVRLQQVARLDGGLPTVRDTMSRLDVAELGRGATSVTVTRDEVTFRLLLAGFRREQFTVVGSMTRVQRVGPPSVPGPVIPASGQEPAAPEPVVIKPRDAVRLVARVGPASVTATGEALQEGRVGQSIRVRNVDSNRIVQGRVAGPGCVEIEY